MIDKDFITPPNHVNFHAKKVSNKDYQMTDASIAYLDENGGGPIELHTHDTHNHLFIVTEGQAKVLLNDEEIIIKKNESYLVDGTIPHSVWNNYNGQTVMIGISVKR